MQSGSAQPKYKIQIPFGQIEYTCVFKEPIVKSFFPPSPMIANLIRALTPYGFSVDGVETRMRDKLSECVVELRRTPPMTSFKVAPGKLVVTADNLDWSMKDKFLEGMKAGLQTVLEQEHAQLDTQIMVLAMHVQPEEKPRKDLTAPLLTPAAYSLLEGDSEFQGIVLTRTGSSVVIDASATHANALFIRLVRQHKAAATLEQIAEQLYADEVQIFNVLGLEGEL